LNIVKNKVTWLSNPIVNNIKKKSTAHKGEIGNLATASGYATKTNPGPKKDETCPNQTPNKPKSCINQTVN
jgi:hypothetical protein